MRMFIQHLGDGANNGNFIKTMRRGVSPEVLQKHLSGAIESVIADNPPYLALWGQTPTKYGTVPLAYSLLEEDDPILFYSEGRAFFAGRLAKKIQNRPLSLESWGALGDGRTWEHLLIIKKCRNVNIPLNFRALIKREYTIGGNLLTESETGIVIEYIKEVYARRQALSASPNPST